MKMDDLRRRLSKERATRTIELRVPEDVVDDLKLVAARLGFSSHESLMRAYIGQGLRTDLERLEAQPGLTNFVESLRRRGVADDVIASAIADAERSAEAA